MICKRFVIWTAENLRVPYGRNSFPFVGSESLGIVSDSLQQQEKRRDVPALFLLVL